MPVPLRFCWSKIGVEAGESVQAIIERKEEERRLNGGLFLWGVGNSLGPSIGPLLRKARSPEVLFSPIKSPPRQVDSDPQDTILWRAAETIDGFEWPLPPHSVVTSRHNGRGFHFALVCRSETPLSWVDNGDEIDAQALRNLRTGGHVGNSQVTSIVEKDAEANSVGLRYPVVLRARLAPPYFVRLVDGVVLSKRAVEVLKSSTTALDKKFDLICKLKQGARRGSRDLFAA